MRYVKLLAIPLLAIALIGCRTSSDRTAGRMLDDRVVNNKVKDALADAPVYKYNDVTVSTYNGIVQLSGWVNNDEQKNEAAELARKVQGVNEVVNNITLKQNGTAIGGSHSPTQSQTGSEKSTDSK